MFLKKKNKKERKKLCERTGMDQQLGNKVRGEKGEMLKPIEFWF